MSLDEDYIANLQYDNEDPDIETMYMIKSIFDVKEFSNTASGIKDVIIAGILFAIFSIPIVDEFITKILKMTKPSVVPCIAVKVVVFMTIIFFTQNYSLVFT